MNKIKRKPKTKDEAPQPLTEIRIISIKFGDGLSEAKVYIAISSDTSEEMANLIAREYLRMFVLAMPVGES